MSHPKVSIVFMKEEEKSTEKLPATKNISKAQTSVESNIYKKEDIKSEED